MDSSKQTIDPRLITAQDALANNDLASAGSLLREVLGDNPKDTGALSLLSHIQLMNGAHDAAASVYEHWRRVEPDSHMPLLGISKARFGKGESEVALQYAKRALDIAPDDMETLIHIATVHERIGEYEAAQKAIDRLLELGHENTPGVAQIRVNLAFSQNDFAETVRVGRPVIEIESVRSEVRRGIAYTVGKAYDKLKDADNAMEAWGIANSLLRRPFDRFETTMHLERDREVFTRQRLDQLVSSGCDSELPVFIVGMPRSGTTLTEQILDAHPKAAGAGELGHFLLLVSQLHEKLDSFRMYPDCVLDMTEDQALGLANEYLKVLEKFRTRETTRVVNKSLDNFMYLGFLECLFPKARVISISRHPVDNCLSIYMNGFHPGKNPWASDLGDIAFYRKEFDKHMAHWREHSNLAIYELEYENLIANPERITRELVDFCGLEWDDACLAPHKSKRTVMTLSYNQVNQPIYKSAIGRYERYKKHLEPVFRELDIAPPVEDSESA